MNPFSILCVTTLLKLVLTASVSCATGSASAVVPGGEGNTGKASATREENTGKASATREENTGKASATRAK